MSPFDIALRDARDSPGDQAWIAQAFRDYLRDLSPSSLPAPLAGDAVRDWLRNADHRLLCITLGHRPAGFALLVSRPVSAGSAPRYHLSDFYVSRECRRRGVGRRAARLLMDRFAGDWEVRQPARNSGAVGFWRSVIRQYTAGAYEERFADGEVCQRFRSGPPPASAAASALQQGLQEPPRLG